MNQEETMLLHKERYKETIKNLTVMSDILARNVFKDKNACEYVLRIILEDKELTVIDNETQMDFRNMHGRASCWTAWQRMEADASSTSRYSKTMRERTRSVQDTILG